MPSYQDLKTQIASLQAQAEAVRRKELTDVINEIKEKMALYALKAEDLGFKPAYRPRIARITRKSSLPAKYRNPLTGEMWNGHGRAPKWIAGKPKEQFLIQDH